MKKIITNILILINCISIAQVEIINGPANIVLPVGSQFDANYGVKINNSISTSTSNYKGEWYLVGQDGTDINICTLSGQSGICLNSSSTSFVSHEVYLSGTSEASRELTLIAICNSNSGGIHNLPCIGNPTGSNPYPPKKQEQKTILISNMLVLGNNNYGSQYIDDIDFPLCQINVSGPTVLDCISQLPSTSEEIPDDNYTAIELADLQAIANNTFTIDNYNPNMIYNVDLIGDFSILYNAGPESFSVISNPNHNGPHGGIVCISQRPKTEYYGTNLGSCKANSYCFEIGAQCNNWTTVSSSGGFSYSDLVINKPIVKIPIQNTAFDLYTTGKIELEAVVQNSNFIDKITFDWFIENENKVEMIAEGTNHITVQTVGNYYAVSKLKDTYVFNSNNEFQYVSSSDYPLSTTNKVKIYNSSDLSPNILNLVCSPNPADNEVSVSYEYSGSVTSASIQIYNQSGNQEIELVKEFHIEEQLNSIDLSWLNTGTYIVMLTLNNGEATKSTLLIKN